MISRFASRREWPSAGVVELVDAPDSKSGSGDRVSVRFRPPAPIVHFICPFIFRSLNGAWSEASHVMREYRRTVSDNLKEIKPSIVSDVQTLP